MASKSWTSSGHYTWTVPSAVNYIDIEATGASGESSHARNESNPGDGAKASATDFSVTPGETIHVYVGGKGGDTSGKGSGSGGFNGGGSGGKGTKDGKNGGAGGGGASDVRRGGDTYSDRIIVAGGGGGAPQYYTQNAGDGGDPNGYDGVGSAGGGATQSSGNAVGQGGSGGDSGMSGGGGGGGGGYYGGHGGDEGRGTDTAGAGGGGSSWVTPSASNVSYTRSANSLGDGSVTISYQKAPSAPAVTATVNDDDGIEVNWTEDTDGTTPDAWEIQINRDGTGWTTPAGGPSSVNYSSDQTSYSATYTPASDSSYGSQVGTDSSFQFRVRGTNDEGDGNWGSSGTVYTTPIPPHDPSVSRPDGTTIKLTWTNQSNIQTGTWIEYRKDTGSGYGSWTSESNTTGTTYTFNATPDSRYQFRLAHSANGLNNDSKWTYADYGNAGNLYFSDSFESGGLSNWTNTSLADAHSGVVTEPSSEASTDTAVNSSDEGSYMLELQADDSVEKVLGDLSGESGVHVRAALAAGSMDTASEAAGIEWSPDGGSTWVDYDKLGWSYNRQGWVEVHADIAAEDLGANCRLRVTGYGWSGDFLLVDRVVVADVVHEYTMPATPSDTSLDASGVDGMTASWSDTATFEDRWEILWRRASASSWSKDTSIGGANVTQHTLTGLLDGEEYDAKPRVVVEQPRHGSQADTLFWVDGSTATAVTTLPAPTDLTVDAVNGNQATVSWTPNHDYGHQRVELKPADGSTWSDDSGQLSKSANSYTTTNLRDGEEYDLQVVAYTEHTEEVDQ